MTSTHEEMTTVRLAGAVSQGAAIDTRVATLVSVPRGKIDVDDVLYRVACGDLQKFGIEREDLLVVEPRPDGDAATGELVLASFGERIFVGRWWTKGGQRALLDHAFQPISEDAEVRVLGAVTVVLREDRGQSRRRS